MPEQEHGILEDIAGEIGYTATTILLDWWGGKSIYVPERADPSHKIAKMIGMPAFRRLVDAFPSQTINLPGESRRELVRRDRMIATMLQLGASTRLVAERAALTERQVFYIRRRLEDSGAIPMILRGPCRSGAVEGEQGAADAQMTLELQ